VWVYVYASLIWTLDGGWMVSIIPLRVVHILEGFWVSLRSSLDRCGEEKISCSYRSSNLEPSSPYRVALPTKLAYHAPTPFRINDQNSKHYFSIILDVSVCKGSLCATDFKVWDATAQNVYFSLVAREPTILLIASEAITSLRKLSINLVGN
jgi:hypothetical protein